MRRYKDVETLCHAYAELETLVHGVKSQDPARLNVQTTRKAITAPPAISAWMDIRSLMATARARVEPWRWRLWWLVRIRQRALRPVCRAHNTLVARKGGYNFVQKTTLSRMCTSIDEVVLQVMSDYRAVEVAYGDER